MRNRMRKMDGTGPNMCGRGRKFGDAFGVTWPEMQSSLFKFFDDDGNVSLNDQCQSYKYYVDDHGLNVDVPIPGVEKEWVKLSTEADCNGDNVLIFKVDIGDKNPEEFKGFAPDLKVNKVWIIDNMYDCSKVSAEVVNGVLKVFIPKDKKLVAAMEPKEITIK